MKQLIYVFTLLLGGWLLLPGAAQAQVKIGANAKTIGQNSNLEVEAANGNKTIVDKGTGNVGIGTTTPGNNLEVNSGTSGKSGLRFTNLNNSTTGATSGAKALGVNSSGDVVTVEASAVPIYVPTLKAAINGYSVSVPQSSNTLGLSTPEFNTIPGASVSGNQVVLPPGLYRANFTFSAQFRSADISNISTAYLYINGTGLQGISSYSPAGANGGAYSGVVSFRLSAQSTVTFVNNVQSAGTFELFGGLANSSVAIEKLQ
ncbi:hypothetical protein F5984_24580 [Rudanella paleaurantiibacter]|uniref:C1q domain-containing protein n=1 Tax=Rudanella paleaurantiibacter TaxID=2614655 RepID=A0A7J5TSM6_9BACT|nr:hypothetical protein [Rudanella paleaurantiibacter]KAB7726495.1 hypothetical protein F5984_24580 [Rudanella paleaurantiibacter]